MKLLQKVLFSLLLATVLFTAFAVAAYSGLFDIIDQQYYNERVRQSAGSILEEAQTEAVAYQRALQSAVGELVDVPAIRNVFLINQSRQDTQEQAQAIGRFIENHPETDYIRIVDNERGNLWYSTLNKTFVTSRTRGLSIARCLNWIRHSCCRRPTRKEPLYSGFRSAVACASRHP